MINRKRFWFVIVFFIVFPFWLSACDNTEEDEPITYTPGCSAANLIGHLNQANNNPAPAIINLDPNCTYILTTVDNTISFDGIDIHSGLPAISSKITINGNNALIDIQKAPGENDFGHFFVLPAGDLELYDLTLQNGWRLLGGAVMVHEGDFFASHINFFDNHAIGGGLDTDNMGGAIYNHSGRIRIINGCVFEGNSVGETGSSGGNHGGAIYSFNGVLSVYSSLFQLNIAGNSGGAIYSEKSATDESGGLVLIDDSHFNSNTAVIDGGAIFLLNETNGVIIGTSVFSGNTAYSSAGAIFSEATDLSLIYADFDDNTAVYGGAIFSSLPAEGSISLLSVDYSEFDNNSASEIGGAIFSENSDTELKRSDFTGNTASSCGAFRNGGSPALDIIAGDLETATRVPSQTRIVDSTFYNNQATSSFGGAICHLMGDVSIQGTILQYNIAAGHGGALFISDEIEISGVSLVGNIATRGGGAAIGYPLQRDIPNEYTWVDPTYMTFRTTISDTNISTNQSSGVGGGIFAHHGGSISINRTTFSYNSSEVSGGGMYQETGDLYITNSTFSGNTARHGGGLYARGCLTNNPILEIKHSTFAYNVATQAPSQPGDVPYNYRSGGGGLNTDGAVRIYNSLVTQNINKDCDLNQCMTYTNTILGNVDSDATCGFSLTETNPMIGPLTWNVGNTATHPLLVGSPLIDILSDCAGLTEDQNGILRPQGNNCDPGAYEFNSTTPPPPPPPPIPPPPPRCDLFDNMEISLTLLDIPPATTNQTLYMTFPGGVPGLELEIPNDTAPWVYRATLGSAESIECSFQGYNGRLYCDFVLSERAFGTVQELFAYLDGCDDPIFYHPRVSIFEPDPSCSADLGEEACEAAGGTFLQVSDTQSICTCP